jgi:hypothetical protein
MTAIVVIVATAAAVSGVVTVAIRSHHLASARNTSEPLVVDAQTVEVDLADANSTIAGGFLYGRVVPTNVQASYDGYLAQAGTFLAAASQRAGTGSEVSAIEQSLAVELPEYSKIVATAEADNLQGWPVGAAYLGEANQLMSATMLPAAQHLYSLESQRLSADSSAATGWAGEAITLGFLALLLALIVALQFGLARRFRRVFSPGGLLATAAVAAVAIWMVIALASEGAAVSRANHVGSAPLDAFTHARILEGQARADDQLSLVTRDAYTPPKAKQDVYQTNYDQVSRQLAALISRHEPGWSAAESIDSRLASDGWRAYQQDHLQVRGDDNSAQLSQAIEFDQANASHDAVLLDFTLSQGVSRSETEFTHSAAAAADDVNGLLWGSLALLVVLAAGVVAAALPRMREYR